MPRWLFRIRTPVTLAAALALVATSLIGVPGWATTAVVAVFLAGVVSLYLPGAGPDAGAGQAAEVLPPVRGRWLAANSPADRVPSHGVHAYGQTYAIDLVYRPDPAAAWAGIVRWPPADGVVVRVSDWQRDHWSRNSVLGVLYLLVEGTLRELTGPGRILGNHIVLDLGNGVYAAFAHLRRRSALVGPRRRPAAVRDAVEGPAARGAARRRRPGPAVTVRGARGPGYRERVEEAGTAGPPHPGATAQRASWDDPRLPWAGRPRKVDIACWAGIMVSGIYYWALLPFRASLVGTHPVLLEVLNGSTEAIVAAAAFARVGHGTLLVVLLAAIPGLMKFDPLYWWAGRLWGERVIMLLGGRGKRGARYMARVHRWGRKFSWPAVVISPFLPVPSAIIYAAAGWAGMGLVTFCILDLIGSLLWAGLLAGLGYALGHHAVVVAQTISRYGLWVSLGLVAVVVAAQLRSQRRAARAAGQGRTP